MNILFTSAGRRVSLLRLFRQAMQELGIEGKIIAADMQANAAAFQAADAAYIVPKIKDPEYIPALLKIHGKHHIDAIFPCFDPDLQAIALNKEILLNAGIRPVVSNFDAIDICFSKYKTYQFFKKNNIPTVNTKLVTDLTPQDGWSFPLFVKPVEGYGSINSFPIQSFQELESYRQKIPNAVVQEMAYGTEFTTDVLSDLEGRVISVVPRQRIEIRAGEVSKGVTRWNDRLIEYGQRISQLLGAIGPICIQCFVDGDKILFTEINPRFGGGVPLTIASGANQIAWILQILNGERLDPKIGEFQRDLVMVRYDEAFFIPETSLGKIETLGSHF